ncbi:MAG: hypothetical protein IT208_08325 [Chthonomonadales bacterium]|nr:hypothetical protein [Chthonomonadales bacterium]
MVGYAGRRRAAAAVLALALFGGAPGRCAAQQVTLRGEGRQAKGWMPGGWGGYRFVLRNGEDRPVRVLRWTARWEAAGKAIGEPWGGDIDKSIEPGKEMVRDEVGLLPEEVVKAAHPGAPVMAGAFAVRDGERTLELPYRFEVPAAYLPEPLKLVKGKTAGMALMRSRFTQFRHIDRTLRWVDQAYQQMIDLTGERPFGGKLMVFKEAPAHPWWAYAGQEMILNTDYVGQTLKDFDEGIISFGWIHEVGHNFDVLGDWYIWSGPAAEWQANFKLAYAFETMRDQSFRIRWTFQAPGYPAPDTNTLLRGTDLVERFFLVFGDAYLADPSRTWDTLSSDEMHGFFQRLQRVYGWDVFRRWYRAYRSLHDDGKKPPEKPEDKVRLAAAVLSRETGVDLVPVFARWRFPVTEESVAAMRDRYGIAAPAGAR